MVWLCFNPFARAAPATSSATRAVFVVNAQSIIEITNQAALDLLGFTKGDLKGKSLSLILPPQV